MSEPELIEAAKQNDHEALSEIYTTYKPMVTKIVSRILRTNPNDREDTVQDCLIHILKTIQYFDGRCTLKTWVYCVAKRECLQALRKKQTNLARNTIQISREDGTDIDQFLEARDLYATVDARIDIEKAISKLTTAHQVILRQRYVDGMTYQEIEEDTGNHPSSSKSSCRRGLITCRQILLAR